LSLELERFMGLDQPWLLTPSRYSSGSDDVSVASSAEAEVVRLVVSSGGYAAELTFRHLDGQAVECKGRVVYAFDWAVNGKPVKGEWSLLRGRVSLSGMGLKTGQSVIVGFALTGVMDDKEVCMHGEVLANS
jgi:hypothetical protein